MSAGREPCIRCWTVARDRSHPEWNEDASRGELDGGPDDWTAFLVVADGAGSTPFAGAWARALVDAARPRWATDGLAQGVEGVRRSFDPLAGDGAEVDFVLEDLWNERGSAATLAVAAVRSEGRRTRCFAQTVGDCLLLVSEPDRLASFPMRASAEFSNRTEAVTTQRPELPIKSASYDLPSGSMLALASDAIGAWLLRVNEREGPARVHSWLRGASESNLPDVDDDVTLVVLDVPRSRMADRVRRWVAWLVRRASRR
jgi:hypothetical protein